MLQYILQNDVHGGCLLPKEWIIFQVQTQYLARVYFIQVESTFSSFSVDEKILKSFYLLISSIKHNPRSKLSS